MHASVATEGAGSCSFRQGEERASGLLLQVEHHDSVTLSQCGAYTVDHLVWVQLDGLLGTVSSILVADLWRQQDGTHAPVERP